MKPVLHLPLDFEQCDEVRTLARILRLHSSADAGFDYAQAGWRAPIYALRLWLDFARVGDEWRPLSTPREGRDWTQENLTHLIEECCGWTGQPGMLIGLFLNAGLLAVEPHGDLDGLTLRDFAEHNPHLLPGYLSQQAKGGHAKAERARIAQQRDLADQQARVLKQQGLELFTAEDRATPDEEQKAIALVMGFDTACGGAMRSSAEYVADRGLMRDALSILRLHAWEDIIAVQRYIVSQRKNPAVVKETAAILRGFVDLLRKTKA